LISTADPGTSEPLALATANPAPAPGSTGVYWSTFSSAKDAWPYHKGKSKPKPQDFDRAAALEGLISRHKHWKNPTIQEILKYASEHPETGIEGFYPTWTTTPLPSWHRGNVVLVGDAAHALQPSSGQGACQALEDAEVLARCLRHFLDRQNGKEDAAEAACTKYEQIRMPRVKGIYDQSQRMSRMKNDMSWIEEMLMYGIVKLSMLFQDGAIEKLVGYDLPAEVEKALADS
jgi:flavin-dependent dehydrogenase